MTTSVIQPGDIAKPGGEPPVLLLPDATSIFSDRARRFATLATNHPLGDWLAFLGKLSAAQQLALTALAAAPLPEAAAIARAREHGMPPLSAASHVRDATWRQALASILDAVLDAAPTLAREIVERLDKLPAVEIETLATRVLSHATVSDDDRAAAPFIAAALQAYWTALAAQLTPTQVAAPVARNLCPVCGSLPVGSVVRSAGEVANLRYLHCSLCNSEWNLARVNCSRCGADEKIAYHSIEGQSDAVQAETCGSCSAYLKIFRQEKEPLIDPVADDLASLALDLLVDEAGFERSGPNLMLLPG
jgi:FdhE protein